MYDYSEKIAKFHKNHVTLTYDQRADMKKRSKSNLDRINKGLEELNEPAMSETISQGSYAQKIMTQPPEHNNRQIRYDIDLGVVFEEDDLSSPQAARILVRDALAQKAGNLKNGPEAKKKCVRIVYPEGYQCDFPVYRRRKIGQDCKYEIASGNDWEESGPHAMNKWVDTQILEMSPGTDDDQLRRIIRLGKFYSKTQADTLDKTFPGGLIITALFINNYAAVCGRDDEAFYKTLRSVSLLSKDNPVYANGVQISEDKDETRIDNLINIAKKSVEELDKLNSNEANEAKAGEVWKKVFCHSFFRSATKPSEEVAALSEQERSNRMRSFTPTGGRGDKPWSR